MTPDEMARYTALAAELERLHVVRAEMSELAAQVYSREGAGTYTIDGAEILLCLAKNGAPYFAPRAKWSKRNPVAKVVKSTPPNPAPTKPRTKRVIVNSQVVEVPIDQQPTPLTGRVIEVTAALTARSQVADVPAGDLPKQTLVSMLRDDVDYLANAEEQFSQMAEGLLPEGFLPPSVMEILPDLAPLLRKEKERKVDAVAALEAAIARSHTEGE